jgi:polysaccharide biosynthesis transport protein
MNIGQLLQILWARRGLVFMITLLALAVVVMIHVARPKEYAATTSLVIDSRSIDPITGANTPAMPTAAILATQTEVITSLANALKVVRQLGLPERRPDEGLNAEGWAYELLGNLTVKIPANGNVLRLTYEDADPQFAAAAANAFANSYLQTSLDLRLAPAKQQSSWFDEQLRGLRTSVEQQRANLSDYQRKNNIVASTDRLDVENGRLEALSKQLTDAQRAAQEATARLRQTEAAMHGNRLNEAPDIMTNGLLQTLKAEQVRAEAKLAELNERYDRNHPLHMSAAAEVRAINQKIGNELQSLRGSLEQTAQIANQQVADLQRSFDAQKTRILELSRQSDEISVRDREVQTAQTAYDAALQRASQVRLESQMNQTSAAVLDHAVAPISPAGLGFLASAVMAIVFGAMLGIAAAVLLEMLDRRVRDSNDLTRLAGIEVLAEVPHLRASFRRPKVLNLRGPGTVFESNPA